MSVSDELVLRIKSDGSVFVEEKGLTCRTKQINPDSLGAVIQKSLVYKKIESHGCITPKGTIYHGFIDNGDDCSEIVVIERDKCIRNYNHFGKSYKVGYPKLLFAYKVRDGRIKESAVVAAKDEIINNNTQLFHFPYANVFSNGGICWGSYRPPEIKNLSELTYQPEAFYSIEHTHSTNAVGQVVKDLLDEMAGKPFNEERLIFLTTFEKFVQNFSGINNN